MKKVAVVLSGCGFMDGAEIHESTLCLLGIEQKNAQWLCFAPEINQKSIIDHLSKNEIKETRFVLSESARIARGKIAPLSTLNAHDFDALVLPGGYGVALNLSTFSKNNEKYTVDAKLAEQITLFHTLKKPIAATCIAPILLAKVFQNSKRVRMTLGTDASYAKLLETLGMQPILCPAESFVYDESNRIGTTPAYMEKTSIANIFQGITQLISHIL